MNENQYFEISKKEKLPNRCPILNYCARRACTLSLFGNISIENLISEGELPSDWKERNLPVQGEVPEHIDRRKYDGYYFDNACPEVNLFESNGLPYASGTACVNGSYEGENTKNKFKNIQNRHFSQCPEFCKFQYENKSKKNLSETKKPRRSPISNLMRIEIFTRDEFKCCLCNKSKNEGARLEVDHIIPLSRGGKDEFSNYQTLCSECNNGKSNKII